MKKGDKIRVTIAESYCKVYSVGDTAVLHHQDEDGDWWAKFPGNPSPAAHKCWCFEAGHDDHFELIEEVK